MSSDAEARPGSLWSVALPDGAQPPFEVFVNSVPKREGVDFHVEGRWLRFTEPLTPKPRLGLWRTLTLSMGIGVYKDLKADVVDVRYHSEGRVRSATGLDVIPPQAPLLDG
jgi:hypothetical protein